MESIQSKYESLWKFLYENNIDIDINNKNRNLICVICKTILKNAQQNRCGCRYCLKCIKKYLNTDENNNDDSNSRSTRLNDCCKFVGDFFSSSKNAFIQTDFTANKKVAMLIGRCPVERCDFRSSLDRIEQHVHEQHREPCPFIEIGCDTRYHDSVLDHFSRSTLSHSRLLISSITQIQSYSTEQENWRQQILSELNQSLELRERLQISEREINTINEKLDRIVVELEKPNESNHNEQEENEENVDIDSHLVIDESFPLRSIENCQINNGNSGHGFPQSTVIESIRQQILSELTEIITDKSTSQSDEIQQKMANILSIFESRTDKSIEKMQNITRQLNRVDDRLKKAIEQREKNKENDNKKRDKEIESIRSDIRRINTQLKEINRQIDKEIRDRRAGEKATEKRLEDRVKRLVSANDNANTSGDNRGKARNDDRSQMQILEEISGKLSNFEGRLSQVEEAQAMMHNQILECHSQMSSSLNTFNNNSQPVPPILFIGRCLFRDWKIEEFSLKYQKARDGIEPYVTSEWFQFADCRMGFKLYPNGDDSTRGSHLSLFLFIIRHRNNTQRPATAKERPLVISFIDQPNGSERFYHLFKYHSVKQEKSSDFEQSPDENHELGRSDFIDLHTLMSDPALIYNDTLIIRFTIGH